MGYRKSEAIGFLALSGLLVAVMVVPFLVGWFMPEAPVVYAGDARLLDSLTNMIERSNRPEYFAFDPNKLSGDSMYLLGLPRSVVGTWRNYRNSGGKFEVKKDFKKIYGLSEEDYRALADFIALPEKVPAEKEKLRSKTATYVFEPVDINKVAATDLLFIKGIGETFSKRIIKFRELLGGYISEGQLNDVYRLEGQALKNLKANVFISDNFEPEKINLNKSSYRVIIKHPYIDKEITDGIFRIRRSADSLVNHQKLKDLMSGKDSLFLILLPYVDF